jgi:hypothetical protein
MTWNLSLIDPGPNQAGIAVPIYGTPTVDPVTGVSVPTITGFVDAFHLNVAQAVWDACPACHVYQIVPANPVVVWAGNAPTYFLKFPNPGGAALAQSVLANWWTAPTPLTA